MQSGESGYWKTPRNSALSHFLGSFKQNLKKVEYRYGTLWKYWYLKTYVNNSLVHISNYTYTYTYISSWLLYLMPLYHNFIISSSSIIYLKLGLRSGLLSQHFFINFANGSGVFFGIGGLKSLFSTPSDTLTPFIFLYGGYLEAISQRIIE